MAHLRQLQAILDAAERRIEKGAGIPHDDFWKQVETSKRPRERNGHERKRKSQRRTRNR